MKSSFMQEVHLKFLLTGLLSGLPLPPFAIRMCPPLTTKNIKQYEPLLAVGKYLDWFIDYSANYAFWIKYKYSHVLPEGHYFTGVKVDLF